MSGDKRLHRVYPALTAKERALLVLRAYKADEDADRLIYDTAPDVQGDEFNRLIRLMNCANVELASVLFVLREQIAKVDMKYAWLRTLRLWADDADNLRTLLALTGKEPITASEYAKREAEAREEPLALATCVQFLMEDYPWADADYVADKRGERRISPKAWARVERERCSLLKRCLEDGTLPSRERGRTVVIPAGAFYDWRGEATPAYPEEAWAYDVRPDDQAEEVEQGRRAQATMRRILDRAPKPLPKPADVDAEMPTEAPNGFGNGLEQALVVSIFDLLRQHWCEARAIEIGVSEITEEFGGEDPLHPDTRAVLDGCLGTCRELRDEMADYAEIELSEPSEDDVAQVRLLIQKVLAG